MGGIIISLIAAVLFCLDIITPNIFIGTILVSALWLYVAASLYFAFGFLKFFYHDFLGWHAPKGQYQWSDGCSARAVCRHCGKDIMQDSQGNWFCMEE